MTEYINKNHPSSISEFRIVKVAPHSMLGVQRAIDRGPYFKGYENIQQISDRWTLNHYITRENEFKMEGSKIEIPFGQMNWQLRDYAKGILTGKSNLTSNDEQQFLFMNMGDLYLSYVLRVNNQKDFSLLNRAIERGFLSTEKEQEIWAKYTSNIAQLATVPAAEKQAKVN